MANYDITAGTSDLNYQKHSIDYQILSRTVDFAKFTGTAAGAAADTADVLNLPVGFVITDVGYQIVTASSTASSVFGFGLTGDSQFFYPNTTSATASAGTLAIQGAGAASKFNDITSVTTLANSKFKLISTADKVRVVLGATAPLNGKVQILIRGFNFNAV